MSATVEVIVRQSGSPDRVVPLREGTSRLGRGDDCEIVLSDVGVSRRHARFIVTGTTVRVEDLGSGNGTYVQGVKIDRRALANGDEVVIDPFVIQLRVQDRNSGIGAPLAPLRARLDVMSGPALAHSTYPIPARGLTIGRSDTRDVVLPDPAGSRHHCSIFLQQRVHVLRDMGSANGLFVNGQRVEECTLTDGDVITIGNTELRYGSEEATGQHRYSSAAGRSSPADAMSWLIVGATVFIVGLLGLVAVAAVVLFRGEPVAHNTTRASGPPSWNLTLSAVPETTDPHELSQQGVALVRDNNDHEALEKFWLLLRIRPGYEAAEVFAYAAGEHVVLDAMRERLYANAELRLTHNSERDALLAADTRASRRTLESQYSDDPVVREALGLGPSEVHAELAAQLTRASELAAGRRCAEAILLYDEILSATKVDSIRQGAQSGRALCSRELARVVHTDWATAVRAQAAGDTQTARAALEAVLRADPNNPSAKFRLERLQ